MNDYSKYHQFYIHSIQQHGTCGAYPCIIVWKDNDPNRPFLIDNRGYKIGDIVEEWYNKDGVLYRVDLNGKSIL